MVALRRTLILVKPDVCQDVVAVAMAEASRGDPAFGILARPVEPPTAVE